MPHTPFQRPRQITSGARIIAAAAGHPSFTYAAAELNRTQAAVSKQINLLEHHLRESLFQRKSHSLVVTKIGAAYLPKVAESFAKLQAGTDEIFGNRRTEILTIRVAAGSGNQFDTMLNGFEVAASCIGVVLGRISLITSELARVRLIQSFELRVPIDEAFHLIAPTDSSAHPNAAAFRDWLLDEAGDPPDTLC